MDKACCDGTQTTPIPRPIWQVRRSRLPAPWRLAFATLVSGHRREIRAASKRSSWALGFHIAEPEDRFDPVVDAHAAMHRQHPPDAAVQVLYLVDLEGTGPPATRSSSRYVKSVPALQSATRPRFAFLSLSCLKRRPSSARSFRNSS